MSGTQGELWDGARVSKRDLLKALSFGARIAEEEVDNLASYFVETDLWSRVLAGEIDIVLGPKGAGKSAIYSLLLGKSRELERSGILVIACENPRGTPAFKDLVADPPTSEHEFQALWKLYLLSLIGILLKKEQVEGADARAVIGALEAERLIEPDAPLGRLLRTVQDYVRPWFKPESFEAGLKLDPVTGGPSGLVGKIAFREPSREDRQRGVETADALLTAANRALDSAGKRVWLLMDRLDVAFAESPELEKNALRALFRVYLDLNANSRLSLKIFLRTDIMTRITSEGFREFSHITRRETISWGDQSLLNLLVRRLLQNAGVRTRYEVDEATVLHSVEDQRELFARVFPDQVEPGQKRRKTFSWMLSRCCDGSRQTAPRELIHLAMCARSEQLKRIEMGHEEPEGEALFEGQALKDAMPEVSQVRLQTALYSENSTMISHIQRLEGEKTQQSIESLARIWNLPLDAATQIAANLVQLGVFELRGSKEHPEYWVPFLYRDALKLVRGSAEPEDED